MVYAQPRISIGEWDAQIPLGFWDTNGSPNLSQTIEPYDNQQKRENLQNCGIFCTADHRVILKESEKRDKYLDLAMELKKLWNMKVMIIPIVIRALDTVTKGLVQRLED